MAKKSNYTDKNQNSTIEFLVVIVIVMILMKVLLDSFFDQQDKITNKAFIILVQNFTSRVNVIHGQWRMDAQPNIVVLRQLNSNEKQYVNVNKTGWVDNDDNLLACHNIWQQILVTPLSVVKSTVVAIEIKHKDMKNGRVCRYSIANGQSFDYRSDTGKVKLMH